jgi:uncharacterized membrane protein (DUF4010 family)
VVSVLRVTSIVLLLQPDVFAVIAPVTLVAAAVLATAGLLLLSFGSVSQTGADAVRNPFELRSLLVFAALFAVVSTASAALAGHFGSSSLLASSAVSGMFDVDVAVLSALRLVSQEIGLSVVGSAVLAALAANAFGRIGLAVLAGPASFWLPLSASTVAAAAAAWGTYVLVFPP